MSSKIILKFKKNGVTAEIFPNLQKGAVISVYEAQKSITRVNTNK